MVLTEIDHVGIAVHDVDAAAQFYEQAFGAEVVHRETVERDGVNEVLLAVAESFVQLLSPIRDDSPVAKYLAKHGEGVHHVAYRVDSCAFALDECRSAGVELVDESPRSGSRGTTVAFLRPKFGHLIELVEVGQ